MIAGVIAILNQECYTLLYDVQARVIPSNLLFEWQASGQIFCDYLQHSHEFEICFGVLLNRCYSSLQH